MKVYIVSYGSYSPRVEEMFDTEEKAKCYVYDQVVSTRDAEDYGERKRMDDYSIEEKEVK